MTNGAPSFSLWLTVAILGITSISIGASAAEYACGTSACIIQQLNSAQPGDRISILPGTYVGVKTATNYNRAGWFSTSRSGTAAAPITLQAADPTNPPVLCGNSNSDAYVFHMVGANYWKVLNIVFRTGAKGVILDQSNNNFLQGIEVYDVGDEGVHFRDASSYNVIADSRVHDTGVGSPGFGEGIYIGSAEGTVYPGTVQQINQACHFNRVTRCELGPNVRAEAVDIKERTRGTLVENCILRTQGLSGVNSADSSINVKGNDVLVRDNQIFGENSPPELLYVFKLYPVFAAGLASGQNATFANNIAVLGARTDVYVLYVQNGLVGKVTNNVRDLPGKMYSGVTQDITPLAKPPAGVIALYDTTADAGVREGDTRNYGLDPLLTIKNSAGSARLALVQFPLSQLTGVNIASATLRLQLKATAATTLNVFSAGTDWEQNKVTWATKPTVGTAAVGSAPLTATSSFVTVNVDVTAYVKQAATGAQLPATLSMAIQESKGKYTDIYSAENAAKMGPRLVIVTA